MPDQGSELSEKNGRASVYTANAKPLTIRTAARRNETIPLIKPLDCGAELLTRFHRVFGSASGRIG
jgi:hypothetical protein